MLQMNANVLESTNQNPAWVHFAAGDTFRGFCDKQIVTSAARGLRASKDYPEDMEQLKDIFRNPGLQMVSFTITEKGYTLRDLQGNFLPAVQADIESGPEKCSYAMFVLVALLYERFKACGTPLAMVSMDNFFRNGEKLRNCIIIAARQWRMRGLVPVGFMVWLGDEKNVSFPWTMIDKIMPPPAKAVEDARNTAGVTEMVPVITSKNPFFLPFVNEENHQYLVIEDRFPNGRPPLEKAGVYMTDRDTVKNMEELV